MIEYGILEIRGSGDFIPDSVQYPDSEEYLSAKRVCRG